MGDDLTGDDRFFRKMMNDLSAERYGFPDGDSYGKALANEAYRTLHIRQVRKIGVFDYYSKMKGKGAIGAAVEALAHCPECNGGGENCFNQRTCENCFGWGVILKEPKPACGLR